MPIIGCPKCQAKLRIPDGEPARRVKCASCQHIFMSTEGIAAATSETATSKSSGEQPRPKAKPSEPPPTPKAAPKPPKPIVEEVTANDFAFDADDEPASKKKRSRDEDDRPRAKRSRDDDFEEDEDDRPRKKRRRDDDEEDDDRPKSKRRRDEDEDDDRPRKKRRRDDDEDEEDDDDRPRSKRRRDDDDDDAEDDYDRRPSRRRDPGRQKAAIEGQVGRASVGMLLQFISGWFFVGAAGLMTFAALLELCGVTDGTKIFVVLAGVLGILYWLTSATGIGLTISGPRANGALGLTIAAMAVSAVHIILVIMAATNSRSNAGFVSSRSADVNWAEFVTQEMAIPKYLMLAVSSDRFPYRTEDMIIPIFANLLEIARGVLLILSFGALMRFTKDKITVAACKRALIGFCCLAGGIVVFGLVMGLLLMALQPSNKGINDFQSYVKSVRTVVGLFMIISYLCLGGAMLWVTLIARGVRENLIYRR